MNRKAEFNRYPRYHGIKKLFKYITIGFGFGIVVFITSIWGVTFSKITLSMYLFYDKTKLNSSYTYKLETDSAEYVTVERSGKYSYTYYFHKTLNNPKTDYFTVADSHINSYPLLFWSYLQNDSNEIVVSQGSTTTIYLDTVVARNYKFVSAPELLKKDTLIRKKPVTKEYLDALEKRIAWCDSVYDLPVRIEAKTIQFNRIEYAEPDTAKYVEAIVVNKRN